MMGTPLAAMPPEDDQRRRWYRRPLWLITVAVVVIAALVLAVAKTTGGSDDGAPAVPTPTSTPPVSNGQDGYLADTSDRYGQRLRVPANPAGHVLPQAKPSAPLSESDPARGVEWQKLYDWGTAVFTTSDGPTSITDSGIPEGIAHTPQGSVVAATQINARVLYSPLSARPALVENLVIGPDSATQQLLVEQRSGRQNSAATYVRIDDQYTDTFSRVLMATGPIPNSDYPSGQYYTVATMTMVWDSGRWKWRIPDDGFGPSTANTRVESVAGWTRW